MTTNQRLILLFIIAFIIVVRGGAQNLIPNSSFEDNGVFYPNYPYASDQLEYMKKWKNFESADWYCDQFGKHNGYFDPNNSAYIGSQNSNKMYAHTGNKFIGFGSCEGAQVELTDKTKKMHWITVSFWFSPRGNCDTKINAYLLKDQAGTNALYQHCNSPNISYEVHYEIDVKAMQGPDQKHVPGNWYLYQSEPGNTLPSTIISSGGALCIKFKSDVSTNSTGWTASYTSTGIIPACGGGMVLSTPSGTFSDGSGSGNYGNNQQCYWVIATL